MSQTNYDPKTQALLSQVDEVKIIMSQNVDKIVKNMDNLEDLESKTERSN